MLETDQILKNLNIFVFISNIRGDRTNVESTISCRIFASIGLSVHPVQKFTELVAVRPIDELDYLTFTQQIMRFMTLLTRQIQMFLQPTRDCSIF